MRFVKENYRGRNVRVFSLDRVALLDQLRQRAQALVSGDSDVVSIWLIGSLARDEAKPGSDVDLVVFVRQSSKPFVERSASYARAFSGLGIGCEVRAYTLDEWQELSQHGAKLVDVLNREGVLLASRREPSGRET